MGGRGAASPGGYIPYIPPELPYNVVSFDDNLAGASYPFLAKLGKPWRILSSPIDEDVSPLAAHTFGHDRPTLRWLNGDQIMDLYVDDLDTVTFLAQTGLELNLDKGGFVLSKRLSRIFRPHYVSGFFPKDQVGIAYMEQDEAEAKVWDGAGLISRRLLRKMMLADDLTPVKRARLERELRHAQRVEFTIMTTRGQDKGHAMVVDDEALDRLVAATAPVQDRLPAGHMTFTAEATMMESMTSGQYAVTVEATALTRDEESASLSRQPNVNSNRERPVDFLLPRDTKGEIRLGPAGGSSGVGTSDGSVGQTFVGINFVHGHNDMRLDIQSLINLHPFFSVEKLLGWLNEEGDLFVDAVETSRVAEAMGKLDRHTTVEQLQAWPLREYFASGGQPLWFRTHVKSLLNQHLKRLNHSTLEKMRLPIPGGRHYVMPAEVGQRAGKKVKVERGEIHIDAERATAWVNDEDWLSLRDARKGEGIADILGGADNDDALWLHPFTDHDEERKVLAWRSPNQVGEYVILKPTADSHRLGWSTTAESPTLFPEADSRQLPPRVDAAVPDYLGLVDAASADGLGEGEPYSVEVMDTVMERALANKGALGMYCNALMLNKALYNQLPANPPAPLEDIIDGAVKTGTNLGEVTTWNYDNSRAILESRQPIPRLLHRRLSVDRTDKENRPPPPRTSGQGGHPEHWLDQLERGIQAHTRKIEASRDTLAAVARPPQTVLDIAGADAEQVKLGAGLNKAYAAVLKSQQKGGFESVLDRAKWVAEDYLSHFRPEQRGAILLGALASVYGNDKGGSDTAVSLAADKGEDGIRQPGIATEMIELLRELGVLDDIIETKEGLIVYAVGVEAAAKDG